jgi:hypothetical protein
VALFTLKWQQCFNLSSFYDSSFCSCFIFHLFDYCNFHLYSYSVKSKMLNCLCLHWNWQVLLHTFLLYITNNQMLKVNLVMLLQNCLFITDRWSRILKTPHMHNQLFLILVSEVFCHVCRKLETISILNYNASKWPWYLLHIFFAGVDMEFNVCRLLMRPSLS